MKVFCRYLAAMLLALATLSASASPDAPQNGVDYLTLENPQPAEGGGKVEVLEFFGYFCSHCRSFDAALVPWMKKHKGDVAFKRVHVGFSDNMALQQRLFYTVSAMGKMTNSLHHTIFDAVQVRRTPLRNETQIAAFAEKNGIDRNSFTEMYRSSAVRSLCDTATRMQSAYRIDSVPTIVIDGRYVTSLAIVSEGNNFSGTEEEIRRMTMQVMDYLVAKTLKERETPAKSGSRKK